MLLLSWLNSVTAVEPTAQNALIVQKQGITEGITDINGKQKHRKKSVIDGRKTHE